MSDDKKDNVVEGIFRRPTEDVEESFIIADAGEMLSVLSEACEPEMTAAITVLYTPGMPLILAANVDEEYVNVLLDMAKYEIMHRMLATEEYDGGTDDTIH